MRWRKEILKRLLLRILTPLPLQVFFSSSFFFYVERERDRDRDRETESGEGKIIDKKYFFA